jgi:two-component system response regulator DevR
MSASESIPQAIRLLIVDDHEVVRLGLRALLDRFPDLKVVGETGTVAGAVEESLRLRPDVVLLDIRLPDGSGYDACMRIRAGCPSTKVLVLTSFAEDDAVLRALSAGAAGYLVKGIDAEGLIRAVRGIAAGQSILDPAVTHHVIGRLNTNRAAASADDKFGILSAQERRVLALVAEGKTNKEIAADMGLSDKTIKNYFSNILDKLNLARRSQAAAYFVQHSIRP